MRAPTCGGASPTARFSASALIDRRAGEASSGAKSRTARAALEVSCPRAVRSLALARRRSVGSPGAASRRGFQTLRGPSPPFCGAHILLVSKQRNLHFFKTTRPGELFAPRKCRRSLERCRAPRQTNIPNTACTSSPILLTGSRGVEGTRARMVLGRVLLAGGGGGDGAHGTPRHPENSLPSSRDARRVSRGYDIFVLILRPSLVAAPPFTFEELVSFCGVLLLFWIVGKLTEKIGLPSVRHPPLSIPRDRRRGGVTTASPPSRPSVVRSRPRPPSSLFLPSSSSARSSPASRWVPTACRSRPNRTPSSCSGSSDWC